MRSHEFPLTKIVCTLGPASATDERILQLAASGMSVARINFSHGDREQHRQTVRRIKKLNKERGLCIATMLDTKGAEIRTGDRADPLVVSKGQVVVFSSDPLPKEKHPVIHVNYDNFGQDVLETDRILIDNGELTFTLVKVRKDGSVEAKAEQAGTIGSRRHINLPGADVDLPSVTENDWKDLQIGVDEGMDFTALSFIRTADEVQEVRAFLDKRKSDMRVFTKIETRQAVDNFRQILEVSDGIMVARGDLGAEVPYERIPVLQDMMVTLCKEAGKPVIVATHMMESMREHPMPTRAEVTDVSHAATTQADATMLSAETASGKFPIESLEAMAKILHETEVHLRTRQKEKLVPMAFDELHGRAEAAVNLAATLNLPAIVVLTHTGKTAQALSTLRPMVPVYALTDHDGIERKMQISYGVRPFLIPFSEDPEKTVATAFGRLIDAGVIIPNDRVVLVSDTLARDGKVGTVQLRSVPGAAKASKRKASGTKRRRG